MVTRNTRNINAQRVARPEIGVAEMGRPRTALNAGFQAQRCAQRDVAPCCGGNPPSLTTHPLQGFTPSVRFPHVRHDESGFHGAPPQTPGLA